MGILWLCVAGWPNPELAPSRPKNRPSQLVIERQIAARTTRIDRGGGERKIDERMGEMDDCGGVEQREM